MRFTESEKILIVTALRSYQRAVRELADYDEIEDLAMRFVNGEAKPYLPEKQPTLFDTQEAPS